MAEKVDKYPFLFVGLLVLFVGWFSVFTGFAGVILAEDFEFFVELENFMINTDPPTIFLIKQVITEEQIQLQMAVRIFLGFILIFIGNSFLLASKGVDKKYCRPCFDDIRKRI